MKFRLKRFEVSSGRPIVFLHEYAAKALNLHVNDSVEVCSKDKRVISRVDILQNFLLRREVALSNEALSYLGIKSGFVELKAVAKPKSSLFIAKKVNGKTLSKKEIFAIIQDIVNNSLTEVEIAQFIVGVYKNGMSPKETVFLTEAMYKTGQVLKWDSKDIVDKHSIGGIAGNRTTPIVVSICSALGVIMPKTSSRAITSASGTADVIETLARVDFQASELQNIVKKTNACLAWGGSLGLAPSDDKLIKIERVLNLDPESQLIASILSKKLAAGSNFVLIDIPFGEKAKVSREEAELLREKFLFVGEHFGLTIKVVLTDGTQPIGNGIGPILEMLDVLKVLKREDPPRDLEKKSVFLAGQILEMVGKANSGEGEALAFKTLESGAAYKKFDEIITAQGKKKGALKLSSFSQVLRSKKSGEIREVDNMEINRIARILGCPVDKGSGIYIFKHRSEKVRKGDKIMVLYSESREKLKEAIELVRYKNPLIIR